MLHTLVLLQQHDPYYQHVEIGNATAQTLPEDGQLAGFLETAGPVLTSVRDDKEARGLHKVERPRRRRNRDPSWDQLPVQGDWRTQLLRFFSGRGCVTGGTDWWGCRHRRWTPTMVAHEGDAAQ